MSGEEALIEHNGVICLLHLDSPLEYSHKNWTECMEQLLEESEE